MEAWAITLVVLLLPGFFLSYILSIWLRCKKDPFKKTPREEEVNVTLNTCDQQRTSSGKRIILSLPVNSSVSGQQVQVEDGSTNYVLPPSYWEAIKTKEFEL